ncbi:MAG: hypothetical protein JSU96_18060 [Acidobacteriota bacterium]|nr:MAG: hypothetical protein JSU96_18060 [Acidobacteriota bacterium]
MSITLGHAIAGVLASTVVLVVLAFLALRNTKTVHPVHCVHCWKYEDTETLVAYSEQPHQWAICTRCIDHYWRIGRPDQE